MSDDPIAADTELMVSATFPLIYDDTIDTSSIQRILFVNSGAKPLETYANATTFTIVYDSSSSIKDIWELMRRKFPSQDSFTRIGFAFHNHGDLTRFCNQEPWFSDADLEDPRQTEFSQNAQFMFDFLREFKVTHVDFLACRMLQSEKWRKYYQLIQTQTGVIVGASDDDTGNVKYGGDWILESTMEDIREVYFTGEIENYTSLLLAAGMTFIAQVGANNASLTILGDYMYTYAGGGIKKIDLRTNTVTDFYTRSTVIRALCAHGNFLYFNNVNSVAKLNISDGSVVNLDWVTGIENVSSIVTDGTRLYVSSNKSYGRIYRVSFSGIASNYFGSDYPLRLSYYDNHLYVIYSDRNLAKFNVSDDATATFVTSSSTSAGGSNCILARSTGLYIGQHLPANAAASHGIMKFSLAGVSLNTSFFANAEDSGNYTTVYDIAEYNNKLYCASFAYGYVFSVELLEAPVVTDRPTAASAITYPAAIGSVTLTGGVASVPGAFRISSTISSNIYNADTFIDVSATFVPTDAATYRSVSTSVPSITVLKGTPFVAARPTSGTTVYPNKLSTLVITGGLVKTTIGGSDLSGTFLIHPDLSNSIFPAGTYQDVSAVFVPSSTLPNSNYNQIGTTIQNVTVGLYDVNNYHYTFYTVAETNPTVMTRTIYDNVGTLLSTTDISYGGQTITNALATMNGGGTNPFTLGIVDSSRNKIKMDVAYSNVYTKALTATQKTKLMSYVNSTFKEPRTIFTNRYIVTVSGGSYWIASLPSLTPVKTPTITFTAGSTYIFDQSHVSNRGKPIVLYRSNETTYTTGVTTIGTSGQSVNAYTQVIIPSGFSESLVYYLPGPVDFIDRIRLKYFKSGTVAGFSGDWGPDTPDAGTAGSVYGRLTAMSGDGKVYAITSGPFTNNGYSYVFRVFSALDNAQIGGDIINSKASLRTRNIGLNYDGTIFFAKSQWSFGLGNTGEFVAHEFSNNAWTLKGYVDTPNTAPAGGARYGCNFAASDNGNLVHIAYNFTSPAKRVIETYVYDSTLTNKYRYKNMQESPNSQTVDNQNGQYISGTRDGTRIATGLITGNLTVYDYNVANNTYTQVGNSPAVSTGVISTKISSNGTTVSTMDNTKTQIFKIYDLLNGVWNLSYTGSTSYTGTLPKINSTGSILASTSFTNKVYYYVRNESDLSYSLTRTMDLSYNPVRDFHSTAYSDNLYSFVFGYSPFLGNRGNIDIFTYVAP